LKRDGRRRYHLGFLEFLNLGQDFLSEVAFPHGVAALVGIVPGSLLDYRLPFFL
jgi:hypothetical protein